MTSTCPGDVADGVRPGVWRILHRAGIILKIVPANLGLTSAPGGSRLLNLPLSTFQSHWRLG